MRKQTALKTTVKVVTKIKRTLQAYALARPYLRLSLKILKAKNDKDNWKYPKTGQTGISKVAASPLNAAAEIIGKRIIDQCQWTTSTWSSAGEENSGVSEDLNHSANQAEAYTFEAVIARPDCGRFSFPCVTCARC